MRTVIIPHLARIKSLSVGETRAETLRAGNQIIAYNFGARQLTTAKLVDIQPVGKSEAWSILLAGHAWITLGIDTVVVTKEGEKNLLNTKHMIGSCILRPSQLLTREISIINPIPNTEMLQLIWETPDYIIADGILVGSGQK